MHPDTDFDEEADEYYRKSKSQVKREMVALQKLGERLIELSVDQIKKIEMLEELREALLEGKTITKREARRRHMQYIGALMREADPEPIKKALDSISLGQALVTGEFKKIEKWRDGLLEGNQGVINEICEEYPDADRQRIRQLARNAVKEKEKNKPPKSSRALFRYLKDLTE